ncbi:MAG: GNAT family N-acetyltransferase [Paracoccaceae bacterium]
MDAVETKIRSGWAPGLVGWVVAEHGRYYAREAGFGAYFEGKVAMGLGAFVGRLTPGIAEIFWVADADGFLAAVSVDGSEAERDAAGRMHLRWFIAADRARGRGLGGHLLKTAIAWVRDNAAPGLYLDTFDELGAARALYDKAGFRLAAEGDDTTWGVTVREQRFVLDFLPAP